MNPLSEDVNIMRVSLIPSIVRTALNNLNRKNNEGRLFELAKVYNLVKGQELPKEKANLSLAVYGENEDFYTLKGAVEEILEVFCNGASVNYEVSDKKFMHPTRSANVIINDKEVGVLGQLHPTLASSLGIDKTIYVAELSFDDLVCEFNDKVVYAQISKFPNIERDLALILDENVKYSDVVKVIKANGGEFLRNVSLFDIYQGDQIAKGKKSMAFNLNFVSNERTLSVEEIDQTIKNILDDLSQKLGAVLR
jgi:phenylalanyl-tRNA synthetase beta chain